MYQKHENGEWRRLHNEELHNLYRSPKIACVNKSRRLRWVGHVARMEELRTAFKILTGTPTENRHLGRPKRRWQGNINIRMDLKKYVSIRGIRLIRLRRWAGHVARREEGRSDFKILIGTPTGKRPPGRYRPCIFCFLAHIFVSPYKMIQTAASCWED